MDPRPISAVFCALLFAACASPAGSGVVAGSLLVPNCEDGEPLRRTCEPAPDCGAFDLHVDFFALEPLGDGAHLRIQRSGRALPHTDGLVLHVADVGALILDQPLAVGPEEPLRATLDLFESCPGTTQSFALGGHLAFTHFGRDPGDRIAGRSERLAVTDARSGEALGVLRVDFDFHIATGPPYRRFTN